MAKTPAKADSLVEKIGDGSTTTRDGQSWSTESWDPISRDENLWVLGQHLKEEGALFSDPAAAGTSTASSLSTAFGGPEAVAMPTLLSEPLCPGLAPPHLDNDPPEVSSRNLCLSSFSWTST